MPFARFKALHAILTPRVVKWGGFLIGAIGAYDVISNQFPDLHLTKLGDFLPGWAKMSGALLPWWGWLLILQAVFVYALFEYVRRNVPIQPQSTVATLTDDAKRDINLDLVSLLYFAVNDVTVMFLDGLIAEAPQGAMPKQGDTDHQTDTYEQFSKYIRRVVSTTANTHRGMMLGEELRIAEGNAEHKLDLFLKDNPQRQGDLSKLRRYFIVEAQRDFVVPFLKRERAEVVDNIRGERNKLIERMTRRSPP